VDSLQIMIDVRELCAKHDCCAWILWTAGLDVYGFYAQQGLMCMASMDSRA